MYKKLIVFLLSSLLLSGLCLSSHAVESSAKATVLMVAGSREIVFSENADLRLSMASTTKIMTSLIALEFGDLNKEIKATDETVSVEGTSIGLLAGDSISLYELVCGMLLESGNDAANTVAFAVSGSNDAFLKLMNEKASELGMNNTHFATVSGLDADNHYSTAYDMAILTDYALKNDKFAEICSSYQLNVSYGNPPYKRRFTNHNKLLKLYDGAVGVKTGYTRKSGRCLVSAARRDGLTLICVTLKDTDDWNNHMNLLDYGFSCVKRRVIDNTDFYEIKVGGGVSDSIRVKPAYQPLAYGVSESICFTENVELEQNVLAPVYKNSVLGRVRYCYTNGSLIAEVPLVCESDCTCNTQEGSFKKSLFEKILEFFKGG